ncbi:hypothetical protein CLOM_g16861 [Closterium sp. NIES-68]|nr:hypothetical protein CLOM_g16861 [Closterium sp. NIES-68]
MGFAGVAFQSRAAALAELQHCPQFHDAILTLRDGAMFSMPACLLFARSNWFRRAWEDATGSGFGKCVEITFPPVPGGTESFESILQYCYGLPVNADATNALQLLCCASFLEMCEGSEEDSLQQQAWRYINEHILNEWEDSLRLLETVARDELILKEALKLDLPLHASTCVADHLSAMLSGPFHTADRMASLRHLLARLACLPAPLLSCVLLACRQANVSFVRIGNYLAADTHTCLFTDIPSLAALADTAAASSSAALSGAGAAATEAAASSVVRSSSSNGGRRVANGGGASDKVVCEEDSEEAAEREEVGRAMLFEYACSEALEHAAALQELHHRAAAAAGGGTEGEGSSDSTCPPPASASAAAAQQQQQLLKKQQLAGVRSSTRYMPSVQYLIVLLKHCVTIQEGHERRSSNRQADRMGGIGKARSSTSLQGHSLSGKEEQRNPVHSRGVHKVSSSQRGTDRGTGGGAGAAYTGLRGTKSDSEMHPRGRASEEREGASVGESVRVGMGRRKELLFVRLAHRVTAMPTALSLADLVFLGPATSLLLLHSLRDASFAAAATDPSHAAAAGVGGGVEGGSVGGGAGGGGRRGPPLPHWGGHPAASHPRIPSLSSHAEIHPPISPLPPLNAASSRTTSATTRPVPVRLVGSPAAALGGDLVCDYVHYLASRMTHQSEHHTWLPFLRLCPAWPGLSSFLVDLIAMLHLLFPACHGQPPVPELWSMVDVGALSDEVLALAGKMERRERGEREAEGERERERGLQGQVERERRVRQERALQQVVLELESAKETSTRLVMQNLKDVVSDPAPWETFHLRGLDPDVIIDIDGVTWALHRHVVEPHCPLIKSLLPAAAAAAAAASPLSPSLSPTHPSATDDLHHFAHLSLATSLPIIALRAFPGGPRAFNIVAKWCYGSRPNLSASQAAGVLFAARFLGMDDRGEQALIPVAVRAVTGGLSDGWQACFDILDRCYHDRVLDALVVEFSLNRHFVDSACGAILKLESKLVGFGRWGNEDWTMVNRLLEGMNKLPPAISIKVVQQLWDLRRSHWASVCRTPCTHPTKEHPGINAMATVGSFLLSVTLLSKIEWRKQQQEEEAKKVGQGSVNGANSSPSPAAGSSPSQALSSSSVRSRPQPPYDNILWMLRILKLFISPPLDRPILVVLSDNIPLLEVQHLQFLDLPACSALFTLVSAAPREDPELVAAGELLDSYLIAAGSKRNPPISPDDFRSLVTRLPPEARPTHDLLFEAVCAYAEADPRPATWNLLSVVECGRLTPRCLRLAASAAASMDFGQSAVAGFWLFMVSLLRALMYEG